MSRLIISAVMVTSLCGSALAEGLTVPILCERISQIVQLGELVYEAKLTPKDALDRVNNARYEIEQFDGGTCEMVPFIGDVMRVSPAFKFANGQEYMIGLVEVNGIIVPDDDGLTVKLYDEPRYLFSIGVPADGALVFGAPPAADTAGDGI